MNLKSTKAMRDRAKELATPARDDFDRAVLMILEDFEVLTSGRFGLFICRMPGGTHTGSCPMCGCEIVCDQQKQDGSDG